MKATVLLFGCLLTALAWTEAGAGVISMNPVNGTNPNTSNPYTTGMTSDYPALLVTATGIGRGVGITGVNANNTYAASGFASGATLNTSNNDYYTFTITASPGYQINFSNFTFNGQSANFGPSSLVLRSSVDNYANNIGSVITTSTSTSGTTYTIDLSGTAFQNRTDITFRLYGYAATNPLGLGQYSVNSYQFNGTVDTVAAVPEPQSFALIGVGSLVMFGYLRRTRKVADAVA